VAAVSRVYQCEYWLLGPGESTGTIRCEYWLPEAEIRNDPRLADVIMERVRQEIRQYYGEVVTPKTPTFDPRWVRIEWFDYDWETGTFLGGKYPDLMHPDEVMRPPDDGRMPGGAGERVPRRSAT
jgi:hypothetical protein